jgi:hypothetical protein
MPRFAREARQPHGLRASFAGVGFRSRGCFRVGVSTAIFAPKRARRFSRFCPLGAAASAGALAEQAMALFSRISEVDFRNQIKLVHFFGHVSRPHDKLIKTEVESPTESFALDLRFNGRAVLDMATSHVLAGRSLASERCACIMRPMERQRGGPDSRDSDRAPDPSWPDAPESLVSETGTAVDCAPSIFFGLQAARAKPASTTSPPSLSLFVDSEPT